MPSFPNDGQGQEEEVVEPLHYFHQPYNPPSLKPKKKERVDKVKSTYSDSQGSSSGQSATRGSQSNLPLPRSNAPRPDSSLTLGSELGARGRSSMSQNLSPSPSDSPSTYGRSLSTNRRSPESRPVSYVDLLNNNPYNHQVAQPQDLTQSSLKHFVGSNVSLLDTKKTLEMYRANVKKTPDPAVQHEFANFLISAATALQANGQAGELDPEELIREARHILQKLADRSYPFAQYLLADGYASGFFNKGKEDQERAFPLFVAASKHGHSESSYRAALCYEHGWGCRKDPAKAVQFYRSSASKGHAGAATRIGKACFTGDMGLGKRYREGFTWLKRAAETADHQYRDAPYELGLLHEDGFFDERNQEIVFKQESYAAELYTKAAELGHPLALMKMGEAYEHGKMGCPRDPALSVHFYTGAAEQGFPEAMMALCAWYLVGAPPVLEKDEVEAYEWAKGAAELGLTKAEYAVGYFSEMGIGCRRDTLEANVWYIRAMDHGSDLAKKRLERIKNAASGGGAHASGSSETGKGSKKGKEDKDCVVM
ncbi:uncharacterized protein K452DRAFT_219084 [Aplosporella prunicola CBS 121167]|uniref:HCP-like protein n=1 Tax=Aplosporella prunicola CBS 121167 TaxID=1176127 RepID=A0A6A6BVG7_9PEZI|nr:uncharacterized protein K452DRAFT_219084 [Aplosporella prunicola CBS 121167]KAF2146847.1 hypothetical protein K452DRAFT_219084 [Aplosporella prunicola CBS 121167]